MSGQVVHVLRVLDGRTVELDIPDPSTLHRARAVLVLEDLQLPSTAGLKGKEKRTIEKHVKAGVKWLKARVPGARFILAGSLSLDAEGRLRGNLVIPPPPPKAGELPAEPVSLTDEAVRLGWGVYKAAPKN